MFYKIAFHNNLNDSRCVMSVNILLAGRLLIKAYKDYKSIIVKTIINEDLRFLIFCAQLELAMENFLDRQWRVEFLGSTGRQFLR